MRLADTRVRIATAVGSGQNEAIRPNPRRDVELAYSGDGSDAIGQGGSEYY